LYYHRCAFFYLPAFCLAWKRAFVCRGRGEEAVFSSVLCLLSELRRRRRVKECGEELLLLWPITLSAYTCAIAYVTFLVLYSLQS
jgi:hypothetical protein